MPKGVYKRTKPVWNKGLTKDTDDRVKNNIDKRNDTIVKKYGSLSYNNSEKRKKTCLLKYGVENSFLTLNYSERNEKSKRTCLVKYGYEHAFLSLDVKRKMLNTFKEKYGVNSVALLPGVGEKISKKVSSEEVANKRKQTCLKKYGVEFIMQLDTIKSKVKHTKLIRYGDENYNNKEKEYLTRTINGTLSNYESKPEKLLKEYLYSIYGEDDVKCQYYSEEYPFRADFYIVSLDTYIELNANPRHGTHPFDENNKEDIALLELLKEKAENGDSWSKQILAQWPDLDVRKKNIALKNNLNYIVIYQNNGEDIVYSHLKE